MAADKKRYVKYTQKYKIKKQKCDEMWYCDALGVCNGINCCEISTTGRRLHWGVRETLQKLQLQLGQLSLPSLRGR